MQSLLDLPFGPPAGNEHGLPGVCLFATGFQAAVQHCEKEAKPQGGDPTALSVRVQSSHCSAASPHVASRRVKTSCLLTTTPKQSPLWLDYLCCTSTGSTHCLPARLYLNYLVFKVYYHLTFQGYVVHFPALVFQFILNFILKNVGFLLLFWLPCKNTFMETIFLPWLWCSLSANQNLWWFK